MKRFLAFFLAVLMLAMLCACSTKEPGKTEAESTTTESVEDEVIHSQVFEKTGVLYSNEDLSLTLRKAEIDSLSDYNWSVTLANMSDDVLIFTFDNVYVNNILFDPCWAVKVDVGDSVDENIIWSSPEMEARGITEITRVDFTLRVIAEGGAEILNVDLTNYPSGKSADFNRSRSAQTTDIIMIDNESYRALVVGDDSENRWGFALEVYLENNTEQTAVFTVENVMVNGEASDPNWRCELPSGKRAYSELVWFDGDYEGEAVNTITFDLVIRDTNGNALMRQSMTYNP